MLKFANYPPKSPTDIALSHWGLAFLEETSCRAEISELAMYIGSVISDSLIVPASFSADETAQNLVGNHDSGLVEIFTEVFKSFIGNGVQKEAIA